MSAVAGTYALWLADLQHVVHLIDPVPLLVEQARKRGREAAHPISSCRVGDARELEFPDQSVDVVLELGPLYNLIQHEDRLKALREAFRVLRPGCRIFAAGISRLASALDGLSRDLLADPLFQRIVCQGQN
jgi:ubiquinone/menaquinone biosynthesis C-methylase UbiE